MSGSGWSVLLRHLPNIFTSPSEASKKETVSTPSLVTGTSANDCMFKEISKQMVNEIGSCHLDCFEVWRYCGHLLFLRLRRRLWSRYSRPHVCLVASRAVFGAGTRGERRTFLIRRVAKVIRSDRQRLVLSDSLVGQVSQAFLCAGPFAHGTSIRKRQCSLRSKMVRLWSVNLHHPPPPGRPLFKSLLPQQIILKSNGTSQAGMKSSAGSVVESIQRFDDSVRPFRLGLTRRLWFSGFRGNGHPQRRNLRNKGPEARLGKED